MKRREMIQLMIESMEYWQDSLSKFGGGFLTMMSYVLQEQEKAGMLPPTTRIDQTHRELYDHLDDTWFSEYIGDEQNVWEPESE